MRMAANNRQVTTNYMVEHFRCVLRCSFPVLEVRGACLRFRVVVSATCIFQSKLDISSDQIDVSPQHTWSLLAPPAPFLEPVPPVGKGNSSRGTISIKKSNWSDLLKAFAMSERESVLRLFESAMMNARAVISEMKTSRQKLLSLVSERLVKQTHFRKPCKTRSGLGTMRGQVSYTPSSCEVHTIRCYHLWLHPQLATDRGGLNVLTLTSGSLFITFLMRARGRAG